MFRYLAVVLLFIPSLFAQSKPENNQLGLLLGGEVIPGHTTATIPSSQVRFGASETLQINFAHRLRGERTQLWLEFPSIAGPSHSVESAASATPVSLATFYTTPSFRVNFAAQRTFSPWLSFGGGYALFEGSERLRDGSNNVRRFTNTGALQFGGGIDVRTRLKLLRPIGLRAEVRDFYSFDTLDFTTPIRQDRQNNVTVNGGFIIRF